MTIQETSGISLRDVEEEIARRNGGTKSVCPLAGIEKCGKLEFNYACLTCYSLNDFLENLQSRLSDLDQDIPFVARQIEAARGDQKETIKTGLDQNIVRELLRKSFESAIKRFNFSSDGQGILLERLEASDLKLLEALLRLEEGLSDKPEILASSISALTESLASLLQIEVGSLITN